MLSSRERLQERQGQHAPPRHEYLQQLVDEYQRSPHMLRKQEIVANLANFAYDPINYGSFAKLQIMDLFLDILDADHEETRRNAPVNRVNSGATVSGSGNALKRERAMQDSEASVMQKYQLSEFAIGGICNCIADPVLQHSFLTGDGFSLVEPYIVDVVDFQEQLRGKQHASRLNTILSALSIAFFLLDSSAFGVVTTGPLMMQMQNLEQYHPNVQIANTAAAFRARYEELLSAPRLPPSEPIQPQ